MSLDESNLDSGEAGGGSTEAPSEQSEKQKESSKRAQSQLQKTQKDEQKAKGDNAILFHILSRFIQNPLYEDLIAPVTALLEASYPSRFILCIISLVSPEAAQHVLGATGRSGSIEKLTHLHHYTEKTPFHDDTIHPTLREWVSLWMTTTQEFLIQKEASVILHAKLMNILISPKRFVAEDALKQFFSFFLEMRNISIESKKAETYGVFILSEYEKVLAEYLKSTDGDLTKAASIDANTLFGV